MTNKQKFLAMISYSIMGYMLSMIVTGLLVELVSIWFFPLGLVLGLICATGMAKAFDYVGEEEDG